MRRTWVPGRWQRQGQIDRLPARTTVQQLGGRGWLRTKGTSSARVPPPSCLPPGEALNAIASPPRKRRASRRSRPRRLQRQRPRRARPPATAKLSLEAAQRADHAARRTADAARLVAATTKSQSGDADAALIDPDRRRTTRATGSGRPEGRVRRGTTRLADQLRLEQRRQAAAMPEHICRRHLPRPNARDEPGESLAVYTGSTRSLRFAQGVGGLGRGRAG